MQIEVYDMQAIDSEISITLEAVCDSFSSLLWEIFYIPDSCYIKSIFT